MLFGRVYAFIHYWFLFDTFHIKCLKAHSLIFILLRLMLKSILPRPDLKWSNVLMSKIEALDFPAYFGFALPPNLE